MSPYFVVARRLGGRRAEINSYATERGAYVCTRTATAVSHARHAGAQGVISLGARWSGFARGCFGERPIVESRKPLAGP